MLQKCMVGFGRFIHGGPRYCAVEQTTVSYQSTCYGVGEGTLQRLARNKLAGTVTPSHLVRLGA